MSLAEYNEHIDSALEFLKGGTTESIAKMTEEMNKASENLDFELAAKIRDRIASVKKMNGTITAILNAFMKKIAIEGI